MENTLLTKNFSLKELTNSEIAIRNNIENIPNKEQIENLKLLCENVLQPVRDYYNSQVFVSSGFRNKIINDIVGGAENSQHTEGKAADFIVSNNNLKVIFMFINNNLNYDQLIYEFGAWIHVSFNKENNRKQSLIAIKNSSGIASYKKLEGYLWL